VYKKADAKPSAFLLPKIKVILNQTGLILLAKEMNKGYFKISRFFNIG